MMVAELLGERSAHFPICTQLGMLLVGAIQIIQLHCKLLDTGIHSCWDHLRCSWQASKCKRDIRVLLPYCPCGLLSFPIQGWYRIGRAPARASPSWLAISCAGMYLKFFPIPNAIQGSLSSCTAGVWSQKWQSLQHHYQLFAMLHL